MKTKNIVIFASGSGSNAENIAHYFADEPQVKVVAVYTNKGTAGVIERMKPLGVPVKVFQNEDFTGDAATLLKALQKDQTEYIILAGFLRKIPTPLIETYSERIINIHPALLPKFGGKGMYGARVHQAVHEAQEHESGITVHLVNEVYDEGEIIAQKKCDLHVNDTPKTIESKVRQLEMDHFPQIIASYILNEKNYD